MTNLQGRFTLDPSAFESFCRRLHPSTVVLARRNLIGQIEGVIAPMKPLTLAVKQALAAQAAGA